MVERMKWGRQRIVQQLRLSMRTEQQQSWHRAAQEAVLKVV